MSEVTQLGSFMDSIPIAVKGVTLVIVLILAVEFGYRGYRYAMGRIGQPTRPKIEGDDLWATTLVLGALTLLALLLSFTISMAVDRFEIRRQLVVDEANSVSTTYLRSQLLSEPGASQMAALLSRYLRDRNAVVAASNDERALAKAASVQATDTNTIWRAEAAELRKPENAVFATAMVLATNQMFDLAESRRAALEVRVPGRIITFDIVDSIATAVMTGIGLAASGKRRHMFSTGLFLIIGMTGILIMDLDHPNSGRIRISESPMIRARSTITEFESSKAGEAPVDTTITQRDLK